MNLVPLYAENIVVGVMFHSNWMWYVSPPWLWILDLVKYDKAGGFDDMAGSISYERTIPIVNSETATPFLYEMEQFKVETSYLRQLLEDRFSPEYMSHSTVEEQYKIFWNTVELLPSVAVDFDQQVLRTAYAEPMHISFQNHVPSGWRGYDEKIWPHVPENYRYWIINGIDYIATMNTYYPGLPSQNDH